MKGENLILKAVVLSIVLMAIPWLPLGTEGNTFWLFDFFGKFHPLIVHLPIGILLCLFLLEILVPDSLMAPIRGTILKLVVISAVLAVVAGVLLASSGAYGSQTFTLHKWFGLATALLCVWLYVLHKKELRNKLGRFSIYQWTLFTNVLLLGFAGHYGG